ncbi:MAG: dynamin family protein [Pseudomonadota bacterium]
MAALQDWRARIAVIGQVKAGKSTFLSALVNAPGFLPSEVNPWTTVVTNLHFAHPDDPDQGGIFRFFSEEAWKRVIEGDPEMRTMAEDLLPGFKAEILVEQVEMMRERARKRLGRFYHLLLGREHRYDVVSRDTLERYVCVGDEAAEAGPNEALGRYSDITESADIFFPPGPFASPTVLSDTPGVNDPFLIRDEYTCRSLSRSDIFVMVLSAHQALTEVDLALLRMLSRQEDKRVIVFVNRIDELADPARDAPKVVADVRSRLDAALPDNRAEIYAGSAFWAEAATSVEMDEETRRDLASDEKVEAHLVEKGFSLPPSAADKLALASGVAEVRRAIGEAIDGFAGLAARRRASSAVANSIDGCLSLINARRDELETELSADGDGAVAAAKTRLASKKDEVAAQRANVEKAIDEGAATITAVAADAFASIRRDLDHIVKTHVDNQTKALFETMDASGAAVDRFELAPLALRVAIEAAMSDQYSAARRRLDASVRKVSETARKLAPPALAALDLDLATLPHAEITPTVSAANASLSMDLTSERGWKFWRKARLSKEEAAARLGSIMRREVNGPLETLVEETSLAFAERAAAGASRLNALWTSALDALDEQAASLSEEIEAIEAMDPDDEALASRARRELDELAEASEALAALRTKIASLGAQREEEAAA